MSGHLPTPATKMPTSRLPMSVKRPAATGRVANLNVADPVAEKRAKIAFPGRPGGGLRRSMSTDNLYLSSRHGLNAGASHVTRAPLAKANGQLVNKAASFVKPTVATNHRTNIRRAESQLNVALKRTAAPTIVRKAESQANIANVNLLEDHFQAPAPKKAKRPAWDWKGRMQDQEELFAQQEKENKDIRRRLMQLETEKSDLKITVQEKDTTSAVVANKMTELQCELRELKCIIAEKERMISNQSDIIRDKDAAINDKDARLLANSSQISRQLSDLASAHETIEDYKSTIRNVQNKCSTLEMKTESLQDDLNVKNDLLELKEENISQLKVQLQDRDDKLLSNEQVRRKMHNQILELKGNIRVFVRIRPFLKDEVVPGAARDSIPHIHKPDRSIQAMEIMKPLAKPTTSKGNATEHTKSTFTFDSVLMPNADQSEVFGEVSQLVQSALDGYNVCIFAYGQTGAGKTWTMEGAGDGDDMGIIPRSVYQIFETMASLEATGWNYSITAMFVEIYNETLQDLLSKKGLKLEIKTVEGRNDATYVSNLKYVEIKSEEQIFKLLETARRNRAVAATSCNERSSRSHFVFQLQIQGKNEQTGEINSGTLNLVDLAGSERLKESKSEGDRLTETKSINKSLSNLGNVIMALAQKNPHVPYRNSRLTHLLANSLGGNSKTLMLVNISPKEDHYSESLNSLRFATKVNQCHIGTATKKTKI